MAIATCMACSYKGSFVDCEIACTPSTGCPSGFECSSAENLCRPANVNMSCSSILGDASSDAPPQFSSCEGLAATCGPNGNDNCCSTATPITGGSFFRSHDLAADGTYPSTSNPATVSSFRLDKYEVTVGRFRQFVNAGMGTQPNHPAVGAGARALNGMAREGGWDLAWDTSLAATSAALVAALKCDAKQSWTDTAGANESLPMNCVTWYEAFAFCAWDGGFLPTESEWNYAAAGGSEQRAYPWSNPASSLTIDCSYANYYNGTAFCVNPPNGAVNRVGSESPKGDGKWGQTDLAGNVEEWTLDLVNNPYGNPCNDCANLTVGSRRSDRGGYFFFDSTFLRTASRVSDPPNTRFPVIGVRCARAP